MADPTVMASLNRVLSWIEVVLGGILTVGGVALMAVALLTGHHDKAHGGAFVFVGGVFVVMVGLGMLIPGLVLRMRHPAKWLFQLIPLGGLIYWLTA
jgi:hypothetical protein